MKNRLNRYDEHSPYFMKSFKNNIYDEKIEYMRKKNFQELYHEPNDILKSPAMKNESFLRLNYIDLRFVLMLIFCF